MKLITLTLIGTFLMSTSPNNPDKQMSGEQLDALMTGNTIYLTYPSGSGEIVLWYGADGAARARLNADSRLTGTWQVKGDLSCIKWSYDPNKDSCSKLVRRSNSLVLLENGTDRLLGTVRSIVPGNVEKL